MVTKYRDPEEGYYKARARQRAIKNLERKAKKLGLKGVHLDAWPGGSTTQSRHKPFLDTR